MVMTHAHRRRVSVSEVRVCHVNGSVRPAFADVLAFLGAGGVVNRGPAC